MATNLFKLPPPLESDIQKGILNYLNVRYQMRFWRNMVGGAAIPNKKGGKSFVQFGRVGMSDIFGILPPTGRWVAIEVKRPGQKPTQAQEEFLAMIEQAGGIAFVATSIDDVVKHGL